MGTAICIAPVALTTGLVVLGKKAVDYYTKKQPNPIIDPQNLPESAHGHDLNTPPPKANNDAENLELQHQAGMCEMTKDAIVRDDKSKPEWEEIHNALSKTAWLPEEIKIKFKTKTMFNVIEEYEAQIKAGQKLTPEIFQALIDLRNTFHQHNTKGVILHLLGQDGHAPNQSSDPNLASPPEH
jgi:hypothetical protein